MKHNYNDEEWKLGEKYIQLVRDYQEASQKKLKLEKIIASYNNRKNPKVSSYYEEATPDSVAILMDKIFSGGGVDSKDYTSEKTEYSKFLQVVGGDDSEEQEYIHSCEVESALLMIEMTSLQIKIQGLATELINKRLNKNES